MNYPSISAIIVKAKVFKGPTKINLKVFDLPTDKIFNEST